MEILEPAFALEVTLTAFKSSEMMNSFTPISLISLQFCRDFRLQLGRGLAIWRKILPFSAAKLLPSRICSN